MSDQSTSNGEYVPLKAIQVDAAWNTRAVFSPVSVKELADSIRDLGLLQPLVVQRDGDTYRLVAGFRRYHAIKWWLKWEYVHVWITESDGRSVNLAENLERKQLTILDEAQAVGRLRGGLASIAKRLGKSTIWVNTRLKLLKLPKPVKLLAAAGALTEADIRHLATVSQPTKAARELVRKRQHIGKMAKPKPSAKIRHITEFVNAILNLEHLANATTGEERAKAQSAARALSWACGWSDTCYDAKELLVWDKVIRRVTADTRTWALVESYKRDLKTARLQNVSLRLKLRRLGVELSPGHARPLSRTRKQKRKSHHSPLVKNG